MKIRTSIPNNNKYYIRQVNGGLNGAVQGYPTIKRANVLCNCVGYANGRFNEIINDPNLKGIEIKFKYQLVCNAENFIEAAKRQGLKVSSKPTLGGIMVWQKGATLGGGDGAGHVAIVEVIYKDGSILTSESGYGSMDWAFKNIHRNNSNGRWGQAAAYKFRGCIVNPSVIDEVKGTFTLEVDGKGGPETVMRMQEFFGTTIDGFISGQNLSLQKKYYPSLIAVKSGTGGSLTIKALQKWIGVTQDGMIGPATVKAWQKKIGVTVDGSFGPASMKAWQKYLNDNDKPTYPATKPTTTSKSVQIRDKAKSYALPSKEQAEYKKDKPKDNFKKDAQKLYGSKINLSDCQVFAGTVISSVGYPKMPVNTWKNIFNYLKKNFNSIKVDYTESQLKEGDIRIYQNDKGGYHIWIITGKAQKCEGNHNRYYPHFATNKPSTKHKQDWLFRAK